MTRPAAIRFSAADDTRDVRYRSVKRVASAVGEGAIAVQLVHEYLGELDSGESTLSRNATVNDTTRCRLAGISGT
jgi:hypothetical protein